MKYHALFVIFEKSGKILNCRLLQIIGGALKVNVLYFLWDQTQASLYLCLSFDETYKIDYCLTLKAPIKTAADDKFCDIFNNFRQKKGMI